MNIVMAQHRNNPRTFCFEVPETLCNQIGKGALIIVDTAKGPSVAKTTTGVIYGTGALDIAKMNGATEPLRKVMATVDADLIAYIKGELFTEIKAALKEAGKPQKPPIPVPSEDAGWF
jgi:hypothetical protein